VRALGPAWRVSTSRAEASARASRNTREPKKNQAFLSPPPGSSESQSKKSGGYIMETTFCLCLFSL